MQMPAAVRPAGVGRLFSLHNGRMQTGRMSVLLLGRRSLSAAAAAAVGSEKKVATAGVVAPQRLNRKSRRFLATRHYFTRNGVTEEEQEMGHEAVEARKAQDERQRKSDFEEAYHPLRTELAEEIHARPSLQIKLPMQARYTF